MEALGQCERSLGLLEALERPGQAGSIHKDMAAIEQAQGRLDAAIEHLSKACVELQGASLPLKRETFGDLSPEVADTLQLMGGVEMSRGLVVEAHRSLRKCLQIQSILYGPKHKTTRATQNTVDMLAQAPEVAGRHGTDGKVKTRPPFCAVLSSSSKTHPSMSDS